MTQARATVSLGHNDLPIDCYMINEEFRVSITGVSVMLGHKREWFSTILSNPTELRALKRGVLRYTPEIVSIQGVQTISITDLTTLITLEAFSGNRSEALSGNKLAMALQATFSLGGLDALFRDTFGMPQRSQEQSRKFFRETSGQFLRLFAENQAEFDRLRLLRDDFYFPQGEQD